MILGILTRLAGFSLKRPKLILFIILGVMLAGFGVHYKMIVGERDKLRIAKVGYEKAVAAFELREATFQEDLRIARVATATVTAEREDARAALDLLRIGRENDPEAAEWAAQSLPVGEMERLCAALPEMEGC